LLASFAVNAVVYGPSAQGTLGEVVIGILSSLAILPMTVFLVWLFRREELKAKKQIATHLDRHTPFQQERLNEIYQKSESAEWTDEEAKAVAWALAGLSEKDQPACCGREECFGKPCLHTSVVLAYVLAIAMCVASSFVILVCGIKFDLDKEGGSMPQFDTDHMVSVSWLIACLASLFQSVFVTSPAIFLLQTFTTLAVSAYCDRRGNIVKLNGTRSVQWPMSTTSTHIPCNSLTIIPF
jgi:hypothetical protein